MKKLFLITVAIVLIFNSNLLSQTNLELFQKLINRSVQKVDSVFNKNNSKLRLIIFSSSSLEKLKPIVRQSFVDSGFEITEDNKNAQSLIYVLKDANVEYQNILSGNFFGDNLLKRSILLEGSFLFLNNGITQEPYDFSINNIDTVNYDNVSSLENKLFPFTQGKIPDIPILRNLIQPVIIVGTLVATVILFFTIRSK